MVGLNHSEGNRRCSSMRIASPLNAGTRSNSILTQEKAVLPAKERHSSIFTKPFRRAHTSQTISPVVEGPRAAAASAASTGRTSVTAADVTSKENMYQLPLARHNTTGGMR